MTLGSLIGFDKEILQKSESATQQRQIRIYNRLALMLILIALFSALSGVVYSLIIFHNWITAVVVGLFLGLVIFNFYRMFVITGLDLRGSSMAYYYFNHEKFYEEYLILSKADLSKSSYEELQSIAQVNKDKLRDRFAAETSQAPVVAPAVSSVFIRVVVVAFLAVIVANGLELFMFNQQVNTELQSYKNQCIVSGDTWTLNNILTESADSKFILINANSLLLTFDILIAGLGPWKLLFDLMVLAIFLIPLIVIYKSTEIRQGDYVKELVLHEISITSTRYLFTQKRVPLILDEVKNFKLQSVKYKDAIVKPAGEDAVSVSV
jgi:hypothetical protein